MPPKSTVLLFAISCCAVHAVAAETVLPWTVDGADYRQVFEVRLKTPVDDPAVALPIDDGAILRRTEGRLRFVEAGDPAKAIPFFKDEIAFYVALEGRFGPDRPARIVVYRGGNLDASPELKERPEIGRDYATDELGTPWDFADDKQSALPQIGPRPEHHGDVVAWNGWLTVPMRKEVVCLTYGNMWSDGPGNLKIDSSVYRHLEVRVRQSCDEATWRFYLTNAVGQYKHVDKLVKGTGPQVFRIDLKQIFGDRWNAPGFWGRDTFKAIRIDVLVKRSGAVVVVDYVRLLSDDTEVVAGPEITVEAFRVRKRARKIIAGIPVSVAAGRETEATLSILDENGKPILANNPLPWICKAGKRQGNVSTSGPDGSFPLRLPLLEAAESVEWTVGFSDDLGGFFLPVSGKIKVEPFETPVFRENTVRLGENGYLQTADGKPFYPIGGLYANWPHGMPDASGRLSRVFDLFPCDNKPYLYGFPWPEDVEAKVVAYLDHCQKHGLNTLRLFLRNMDQVGRVDPERLKAVLHLFDLAGKRGIRFNVVLFCGGDKPAYYNRPILEDLVLPKYTAEELASLPPHRARFLVEKRLLGYPKQRFIDPDVRECHKDYLWELIPILAAREEVLCYELQNEIYYHPLDWFREIARFIRSIDPHTLILANPHSMFWPKPVIWRDCTADLAAYHPYNNGRANADMGAWFFSEGKMMAQLKIPFGTGEGGVYNDQVPATPVPDPHLKQRVEAVRDQIWMNFCTGGNAFLYWTSIHEKILEEFSQIEPVFQALQIDLKTLRRATPEVALVMPASSDGNWVEWTEFKSEANEKCRIFCKRMLQLGVDFDTPVRGEDESYPVRLDVLEANIDDTELFSKLKPTVARPSDGWDLATFLSQDGNSAVLYLRNAVGGIRDYGTKTHPAHCRVTQPSPASLKFEDPRRWKRILVYDLVSREVRETCTDEHGTLYLNDTESDFVIGCYRD